MKFYEIKIEYTDQENYKSIITQKIKPLIEELEGSGLIKGFHFIMHEALDLRLIIDSVNDLESINRIISERNISDNILQEISNLDQESGEYQRFGPEGIEILRKGLEFNSRLIIMIFDYKKNKEGEHLEQNQIDSIINDLNHQLVHYFLIQQGINNLEQVLFSLNDSKMWANSLITNFGANLTENQVQSLKKIVEFDHNS